MTKSNEILLFLENQRKRNEKIKGKVIKKEEIKFKK